MMEVPIKGITKAKQVTKLPQTQAKESDKIRLVYSVPYG